MHHNFRNVSIIIWDGKGGKRGWVLSNPNNFLADFFTLLRSTQFGNFPKNLWNLFCLVVPLRHQCCASRSRSTIQYLWEILKSLISQNIRSIFVNFQFFPPGSIDEHFSSPIWKVKVGIRWMLERYNQFRSILLFLCWEF